jgi:2-keto-4-pentenoate hydratase
MVFLKNGKVQATGTTAEVMGNPIHAVTWLINKLAAYGVGVKKGEIILSGSLTAAIPFAVGDVIEIIFDRLGPVSFYVAE